MKPFALALLVLAAPVAAQDEPPSLMQRGAEMFFQGLMDEMQPAMEDFAGMAAELGPQVQALAQEMGPALLAFFEKVDEIRYYQAPEFLPNGDIILRRKPDAPIWVAPEGETDGGVDL
jgi:hypothetical protein